MNATVDAYLDKAGKWGEEMSLLREIIISADKDFEEDFKWGHPCYTIDGANVVLIHGFKEYCALLLFKAAIMDDPDGILVQQTENVQSGRQIRFTSLAEIKAQKTVLKKYLREAVRVERSGLKVPKRAPSELTLPAELKATFREMPELKKAFEALTPGRQRAYALYFADAKQEQTRISRIQKHIPQILNGKGLNE
ncbi:YdeI/OmpD-associated family protein [Rurimicrobium arvi]|uniref:YdeI family protein n=1 Tax=Rurimicrobium arvi TaxID=2049916 RepID=A0ABP8MS69_9BACT